MIKSRDNAHYQNSDELYLYEGNENRRLGIFASNMLLC